MKYFCNLRVIALILVLLLATAVITMKSIPSASGAQVEKTYVLTAGTWSDEQNIAVGDAGGVVTFSHTQTGIAVVTSSAPDFLDRALASKKFTDVTLDQVVQWQSP